MPPPVSAISSRRGKPSLLVPDTAEPLPERRLVDISVGTFVNQVNMVEGAEKLDVPLVRVTRQRNWKFLIAAWDDVR